MSTDKTALVRRLGVSALLVAVALLKLFGRGRVLSSASVPEWVALASSNLVVWIAGVIEFGLAVGILTSQWRKASIATFVFFLGTLVYLGVLVLFGVDLAKCGCFGTLEVSLRTHLLVIIGALLVTYSILWEQLMGTSLEQS